MNFCDYICSVELCSKRPDLICDCERSAKIFCLGHSFDHLKSKISVPHNIFSAYKTVPEQTRKKIIKALKLSIDSYRSFKAQLQVKLKEISSDITKLILFINKLEGILSKNLKELFQNNRVFIPVIYNDKSSNSELIFDDLSYFTQIFQSKTDLSKPLSSIEDLKSFLLSQQNLHLFEINNFKEELYFLSAELNTLYHFDSSNETISKIELPGIDLKRSHSSICCVNRFEVFIYGGSNNAERFNSAYLVNVKKKRVLELPQNIIRTQAAAQLFEERVYVFGGSNMSFNDFTNKCHYFDLNVEAWFSVNDLPVKTRNTSTVLITDTILISSTGNSVFLFDVRNDSYKAVGENACLSYNILVDDENFAYLISGMVYWLEKKEICGGIWNAKDNNVSFGVTTSKAVRSQKSGCYYFVDYLKKIFKFDTKTLEISFVGVA